jgi:multidrug efflux pump subunit AcrB
MQKEELSLIEKILKKPHFIISILAIFIVAGVVGYGKIHRNLFPNSNYPEVAVVVVEAGASAKSMASNIAVPVEEELYTLDNIRRAYSSTIDEVYNVPLCQDHLTQYSYFHTL